MQPESVLDTTAENRGAAKGAGCEAERLAHTRCCSSNSTRGTHLHNRGAIRGDNRLRHHGGTMQRLLLLNPLPVAAVHGGCVVVPTAGELGRCGGRLATERQETPAQTDRRLPTNAIQHRSHQVRPAAAPCGALKCTARPPVWHSPAMSSPAASPGVCVAVLDQHKNRAAIAARDAQAVICTGAVCVWGQSA